MKNNKNGFSLVELIICLSVIALAGAISIPLYKGSTNWAYNKQAEGNLKKLNKALEYYKIQYGGDSIPNGNHDKKHHEQVLALLSVDVIGTQNIDPLKLKSSGKGKTFVFNGYGNQEIPKAKIFGDPVIASNNTRNEEELLGSDDDNDDDGDKNWENSFLASNKNENLSPIEEIEALVNERRRREAQVNRVVFFESPGKHQWIVPEGVSEITIEAVGGGGSSERAIEESYWGPEQVLLKNVVACNACTPFQGKPKNAEYLSKNLLNKELNTPMRMKIRGTIPTKATKYPNAYLFNIDVLNRDQIIEHITINYQNQQEAYLEFLEDGIVKVEIDAWKMKSAPTIVGIKLTLDEVRYQPYLRQLTPTGGGGAGGYVQKRITGLSGGETIFITVGKGGHNGKGEKSLVKINNIELIAHGGENANGIIGGKGGISIGGDSNQTGEDGKGQSGGAIGGKGAILEQSGIAWRGSGGTGTESLRLDGKHGAVKISFKG